MSMLFKMPSVGAVLMLTTFVFGGIGIAYLPTQISDTPGLADTWQARWGSEISTTGLAVVAAAITWFVIAHIRWPQRVTALARLRVRFYKTPYWQDEFVAETFRSIAGKLKVVKKTVEMCPYGWDERDPFIRITYYIFNGAPCSIFFEDPVGELSVGQSILREKPKIREGQGWWTSQATARLQLDQQMSVIQNLAGEGANRA